MTAPCVDWRASGGGWDGTARRGAMAWSLSVRRREPSPLRPQAWAGRIGPGGEPACLGDDPAAVRAHLGRVALREMADAAAGL